MKPVVPLGRHASTSPILSQRWAEPALFVRRTSGLCTAHGRSFDEPVVCAPHMPVRSTNLWFVGRTCTLRSTIINPFMHGTRPCSASKPPVRRADGRVHKPVVRRTNGAQTTCSSNEHHQFVERTDGVRSPNHLFFEQTARAVYKPSVRRANGHVRCTNYRFVERTAVCGACSSNEQANKPPVRRAHGRVRPTNHQFAAMCGAQTSCSSNERPRSANKHPVRRANGACGVQTIGSS